MKWVLMTALWAWWGVAGAAAAGPDPEARTLVQRYNAWVNELTCLTAGGKVHVGAPEQKERAFRFSLAVQQPGSFRMQGRLGAMAQIFDLSQDGEGWTLYLPQSRQVVRGTADTPALELLNPKDYLDALMPGPLSWAQIEKEGALSRVEGRLRISVPPQPGVSAFHRVIDLDRRTGLPARLEIRGTSRLEEPVLTAVYSGYTGTPAFPQQLRVEGDRAWAVMDVSTVDMRRDLDPRRFHINVPYGTEEIPVESLGYEFLPPVEDEP